jgi:signal transduction histidine kinase
MVLFSCDRKSIPREPGLTYQGAIDFENWDFENHGTVSLSRNWEFYPNELLINSSSTSLELECQFTSPNETSKECHGGVVSRSGWEKLQANHFLSQVKIPHSWNEPEMSAKGVGLYRIRLVGIRGRVTLYSPKSIGFPNARIWVKENDHYILKQKIGEVSEDGNKSKDDHFLGTFSSESPSEILVELSNSRYRNASFFSPLILGKNDQINSERDSNHFSIIISIGIMAMTGVYHFIVFFFRKRGYFVLFFGLMSISVSIRVLLSSEIIYLIYPNLNYLFWMKLEYAMILVIPIMGFFYMNSLFEKDLSIRMYVISLSIPFLMLLFISVVSIDTMTSNLPYIQIPAIFFMIYLSSLLIMNFNSSSYQSRLASRILTLLALLYAGSAIHDMMMYSGYFQGRDMIGYGSIVFELGNAFLLAKINSRSWENAELISIELQKEFAERMNLQKKSKELQLEKNELSEELYLASQNLIHAEKLSSLGALVSGITHEINNPVNFIEMSRFQEKEEMEELKQYLVSLIPEGPEGLSFKNQLENKFQSLFSLNDQIKTGVNRVIDINKSMRNASRMDQEIEPQVAFAEVIEETLVILGSRIKEFTIIKDLDKSITAPGRRSQIGQVIMNLVTNACDAILEKQESDGKRFEGLLRISLKKDDSHAIILVEDNGTGIPPSHRDKILSAFFTTKKAGAGTGLGLSIVGKILESHNATMKISDSEWGGAKFSIFFPNA